MPLPLSEYAIDFAASSVLRNASTLPISGFSAPARTTMPISERASSILLSARTKSRLAEFVGRASIQDHDIGGLASRQSSGNRLRASRPSMDRAS